MNIHLLEPLPYLEFVALLSRATLVLTDSGGVQEETPSLGKPVLVMATRPSEPRVAAGTVDLWNEHGNDRPGRLAIAHRAGAYKTMARLHQPYGDGQAAARIATICERFLVSRARREGTAESTSRNMHECK